jgi:hypothetical protein
MGKNRHLDKDSFCIRQNTLLACVSSCLFVCLHRQGANFLISPDDKFCSRLWEAAWRVAVSAICEAK